MQANETIARVIVAEVTGSYEIDGYTEDDYFNGTGAFVVTSVSVVVEALEVFTYDEDGNETASTITLTLRRLRDTQKGSFQRDLSQKSQMSQDIANITKVYKYAEKRFIKHYAPGLADSPDNGQSLCGRPL